MGLPKVSVTRFFASLNGRKTREDSAENSAIAPVFEDIGKGQNLGTSAAVVHRFGLGGQKMLPDHLLMIGASAVGPARRAGRAFEILKNSK